MPRGISIKTPERVAQAQAMREGGAMYKEIAGRFGISIQAAHAWVSDPDGSKLRKRHDRARGICTECGTPTAWGNGSPSTICRPCTIVWTPQALIAAIRDWADEHGGIPPRQPSWNPSHPHAHDWERQEYATGRWPSHESVCRVFGSWNKGLIAAGFEPHLVLNRLPDVEAIGRMLRMGLSVRDIATQHGVTVEAVYMRLRNRGLRVGDFKAAA